MNFKDYAKSKGCDLLQDDVSWLRSLLLGMSNVEIQRLLRQYIDVWCESMALCNNRVKQMNVGRREANIWLRNELNYRELKK